MNAKQPAAKTPRATNIPGFCHETEVPSDVKVAAVVAAALEEEGFVVGDELVVAEVVGVADEETAVVLLVELLVDTELEVVVGVLELVVLDEEVDGATLEVLEEVVELEELLTAGGAPIDPPTADPGGVSLELVPSAADWNAEKVSED